MKRLILKRLTVLCVFILFQTGLMAVTFTDVPQGHWAKPSIDRVVELGILAGFEDDTFRGKVDMNRFEFAVFADNMLRVMDKRYVSKEAKDAFSTQFEAFVKVYEEDRNTNYRVSKEEWQRTLRDLEFLRAEVSELRKQIAPPVSSAPE